MSGAPCWRRGAFAWRSAPRVQRPGARGSDLPVRIGVHTGPVVLFLGPIGGSLWLIEKTAIGDTANVAARLQQAAEPRTILLSEGDLAGRRGSYARVAPTGPLALKGKAEPISAYLLLGISRWRSRARRSDARADDQFRRPGGRGRRPGGTCSIRFKAGSRRSRRHPGRAWVLASLASSTSVRRRLAPRQRHLGRGAGASPTAIPSPYLLVIDLLRSNCGIVETDTPEEITEKGSRRIARGREESRPGQPISCFTCGRSKPLMIRPRPPGPKQSNKRLSRCFAGSRSKAASGARWCWRWRICTGSTPCRKSSSASWRKIFPTAAYFDHRHLPPGISPAMDRQTRCAVRSR